MNKILNRTENYTISDIESLSEDQAFILADDTTIIKGYSVYFVHFDNAFGYSCLVYSEEGKQIRWCNDYELHHSDRSKDKLHQMYIDRCNNKLFTDAEIAEPVKDYFDYENKRKYVMELLPLCRDHLSVFQIFHNDEEEKAWEKRQKEEYPLYADIAFGYFKEADRDFVTRLYSLYDVLNQRREESEKDYEYLKKAYYYELSNHEYHINNYQGDYDTLSAFGNIKWHGQGKEAREMYYKELHFTETQIKAFEDARREFLNDAVKNDWY